MISLPCPKSIPPATIRTFTDNGPYFDATKGEYQAWCLRDFIFHIRQAMEDKEDIIAIYKGDECVGGWCAANDADIEEGEIVPVGHWYERAKPGSWDMKWIAKRTG